MSYSPYTAVDSRPMTPPPDNDDFRYVRAWVATHSSISPPPQSLIFPDSPVSSRTSVSLPPLLKHQGEPESAPASPTLDQKTTPRQVWGLWRIMVYAGITCLVGSLLWLAHHQFYPPRVHLERVAKVTAGHAPFALDVVKDLLEVKEALPNAFDTWV